MKTIFDILRLYIKTPIEEGNTISFDLDNHIIKLGYYHLTIKLLSDKWWFRFPSYERGILQIDKPNKTGGYDTIMIDGGVHQDLFTIDDNQLILIYGRFYPDYLSGDQTELYDAIIKQLDTN